MFLKSMILPKPCLFETVPFQKAASLFVGRRVGDAERSHTSETADAAVWHVNFVSVR